MTAPASLRAFFSFVERSGSITLLRETIDEILGGRERAGVVLDALAKERIVREAPPAASLPCPELHHDCARDVRTLPSKKRPRLSVVCGRSPRECPSTDVRDADLEQIAISLQDIAALVRRTLGVEPLREPPDPTEGVLALGEQARDRGTRDVLLVTDLQPKEVASLVDELDRGPRPTLVLVASARLAPSRLRARHGLAAHVEIDVLADLFHVKSGAVTLARPVRLVEPAMRDARAPVRDAREAAPEATERAEVLALMPTAHHWREVTVTLVDEETVSVEIGRRIRRLKFGDMGLDHKQTRRSTRAWDLLVLCCRGGGVFSWRKFGSFDNARQVVMRLRQALKKTFGIVEDPFHPYETGVQWKTRFVARSAEE